MSQVPRFGVMYSVAKTGEVCFVLNPDLWSRATWPTRDDARAWVEERRKLNPPFSSSNVYVVDLDDPMITGKVDR